MRKTLIFLVSLIVLIGGGVYCIKNGNQKEVAQALQNYNENPNGQQVRKKEANKIENTNNKNLLDEIEGIWGNGIMYGYRNDSKPSTNISNKYSVLVKKDIIISDYRYFNGFDNINYNKEFKDPYYKINKINEKNINDKLKDTYINKEALNGIDMNGQYYMVTITEEKNKDDKEYKNTPFFYTNGKVLIINYKGCFFRYTKLN